MSQRFRTILNAAIQAPMILLFSCYSATRYTENLPRDGSEVEVVSSTRSKLDTARIKTSSMPTIQFHNQYHRNWFNACFDESLGYVNFRRDLNPYPWEKVVTSVRCNDELFVVGENGIFSSQDSIHWSQESSRRGIRKLFCSENTVVGVGNFALIIRRYHKGEWRTEHIRLGSFLWSDGRQYSLLEEIRFTNYKSRQVLMANGIDEKRDYLFLVSTNNGWKRIDKNESYEIVASRTEESKRLDRPPQLKKKSECRFDSQEVNGLIRTIYSKNTFNPIDFLWESSPSLYTDVFESKNIPHPIYGYALFFLFDNNWYQTYIESLQLTGVMQWKNQLLVFGEKTLFRYRDISQVDGTDRY